MKLNNSELFTLFANLNYKLEEIRFNLMPDDVSLHKDLLEHLKNEVKAIITEENELPVVKFKDDSEIRCFKMSYNKEAYIKAVNKLK